MKKTTKHNIYEVWDEYKCDCYYTIGRPTKEDLLKIVSCGFVDDFEDMSGNKITLERYVKDHIFVNKLKPVYSK